MRRREIFKKGLAVVLTTAMALGVPIAVGQDAKVAKAATPQSAEATTFASFDTHTFAGDFNVSYTMKVTGKMGNDAYWDGYVVRVSSSGKVYKMRPDGYGWADGGTNTDNTNIFSSNISVARGFKTNLEGNLYTVDNLAAVDSGVDFEINVKRIGDEVYVTADCEYVTCVWMITDFAGTMTLDMGLEQASATSITYEEKETASTFSDTFVQNPGWSPFYKRNVYGDFDVEFTCNSKSVANNNYSSIMPMLYDADTQEQFRVDIYKFGAISDESSAVTESITMEDGVTWDNFKTKLQENTTYKIKMSRIDGVFTIVITSSLFTTKYVYDDSENKLFDDDMIIALGAESSSISNFAYSGGHIYDISGYRSGDVFTSPTCNGKVFAGWYTNYKCDEAISNTLKTGSAYAKFVDENLLKAKYQLKAGTVAESDSTNVRFITAVDSLDYKKVGFDLSIGDKNYTGSSSTVYTDIAITEDGKSFSLSPTEHFGSTAQYILPCILKNVSDFDSQITVKPYWVTLDGTTVYGETRNFKISDSFTSESTTK